MNDELVETLRKLCKGILEDQQICQEVTFLREMIRWNKKINLTSVTDVQRGIIRHVVDSLIASQFIDDGQVVVDAGSGGGVPVIPLAIARPGVKFISVEAVGKKINFQRHIKRLLALKNITIVQGRIEELVSRPELPAGGCDLVVSRAMAPLDRLVTMVVDIIKPGGALLAFKGADVEQEIISAEKFFAGISCNYQVHEYFLPDESEKRCLLKINNIDQKNN